MSRPPSTATSPHRAVTSYVYNMDRINPWVKATVNGKYVNTMLDGVGRPRLVETGAGTTALSWVATEYGACACSAVGKVKRTSRPYVPNGTPVWRTS